jgi:hypothetical protein
VRIEYVYNFTLSPEPEPVVTTPVPDEKEATLPTGRLLGQLKIRGFRKPLAGVEIRLSTGQSAYSDEKGQFDFPKVSVGVVVITIADDQFENIETEETIVQGQETEVTYYVERNTFDDAVTVVGKRVKKDVVRRTIKIEEIRLIPFGNTDLILRGGGRTQAYVSGQAIPLPFHFGGLRSTISSALISDIAIYPSNFGVEFGRINGGVIDIKLRDPRTDAVHGFVEADVFDAGTLVEGPLGEHGGIAIAFRRSYFDGILAIALPDDAAVSLPTAPRYYDAQALYSYKHGPHRLRLLVFGSSDRFVALLGEARPNNPQTRGTARLALEWAGTQLDWKFNMTPTLTNRLNVSYLLISTEATFGESADLDFLFNQIFVRDSIQWTPSKKLTVRMGTDTELLWNNIRAYGSGGPPKEGEKSPGGGLQDNISLQVEEFVPSPSAWTELQWKLGSVLIVPGVRLDYLGATDEIFIQPRIATRWTPTKSLVIKGGFGTYAQAPEGDEYNDGLGNSNIESETGWHATVGSEYRITKSLALDTSLFYKDFDKLIRRVDDPTIRVDNQGIGRAYGFEFLLRQNLTSRFFGWIAYTLQRSERRDAPGEPWRLFDTDQTHNLIVVAQYKLTTKWTLGMRFRYVTGNPETPVESTVFEADADRFVPIYGDLNSGRFDDFHQLDVRVDRQWVFDTWRLTAYLDVRNVYNRANATGRSYNFDFTESTPRFEIPIVPSFGVRGEF